MAVLTESFKVPMIDILRGSVQNDPNEEGLRKELVEFCHRLCRMGDVVMGPDYDSVALIIEILSLITPSLDSYQVDELKTKMLRIVCREFLSEKIVGTVPQIDPMNKGEEQLVKTFRYLGMSCRVIIALVDVMGCSEKEVSSLLIMTPEAVKRHLHHSRLRYARLLRVTSPSFLDDDINEDIDLATTG
jgi:hypothetical protein